MVAAAGVVGMEDLEDQLTNPSKEPMTTAAELSLALIYADLTRQRAAGYKAGPMGLPTQASAAKIPPEMQATWTAYWDAYDPNRTEAAPLGNGGRLMRVGPDEAVYGAQGVTPFNITRSTNLNWLAQADPTIGVYFNKTWGYETSPLS